MWKWTSEIRRVTIYIKALRFASRFYVSWRVSTVSPRYFGEKILTPGEKIM